ncbi:sensor histidine kinase [Rhizobium oryzicola]|uniref:histidine kinase n=1 Tax=Rhizobium oryzicola TaxID=1232668 RepID=A0ABT8T3N0_9HYPH|nr:sensor histidine kinase [Rhizobium oryzicola]MDO1585238.1 sensor histidine kinase [Rhizobium oryzicola]
MVDDVADHGGYGMAQRGPLADTQHWMRYILAPQPSFLRGQLIAALCVLASVLVRSVLTTVMVGAPFITFFPSVLIASTFGGRAAGATVVGAAVGLAWIRWLANPDPHLASASAATAMFVFFSLLIIAIIHAFRHLLNALQQAEEQADVMAREMRHRVGNIMQLVQAIAQMTARSSPEPKDFMPRFEGRLRALSEAHRISAGRQTLPNDFRGLLEALLSAYDRDRIRLTGPRVVIDEETAPRLALVIHELATNAAKYGSLSTSDGLIEIEWSHSEEGITLRWQEKCGPPVTAPQHRGFGSKLIQTVLSPGNGSARMDFAETGLVCTLKLPAKSQEAPVMSSPMPRERQKIASVGQV